MVFGNGVKNIQAAAYNGVHTVCLLVDTYRMYMMTPSDQISHDLSYFSGPNTSGAVKQIKNKLELNLFSKIFKNFLLFYIKKTYQHNKVYNKVFEVYLLYEFPWQNQNQSILRHLDYLQKREESLLIILENTMFHNCSNI